MLDHYTTPGESIEIRDNQTIYSLLTDRLARTGADTVIAAKKIGPGRWQNVTTGEFHERVVSAAKGLIALGIDHLFLHPSRMGHSRFRTGRGGRGKRADL